MQTQPRGSYHHLSMLALCSSLSLAACAAHDEPEGELDELRIIDGSLTDQWPAVVGISSSVGVCTGTQISDRLILTAAHCLTDMDESGVITTAAPASVSVYWGADLLATLDGQPDPTFLGLRGATRIDIHPDWAFDLVASTDLALITLDGPGFAEPLPIRTDVDAAPPGQDAQLVGFGTFEVLEGEAGIEPQYDGRKREGVSALLSLATLDPSLAPLDETLYAADGTGVAANGCYGDSGGPLLLSEDGQPVVAGVASFVDSPVCDSLTGYARVDVQQDFIDPFVNVSPVLECVDALPDGTYVAHFGYKNHAAWTVERPVGSDNRFHPSAMDRGQPESFEPGRQIDVFTVPFTGTLVWKLGSKTSTASAGSQRC